MNIKQFAQKFNSFVFKKKKKTLAELPQRLYHEDYVSSRDYLDQADSVRMGQSYSVRDDDWDFREDAVLR